MLTYEEWLAKLNAANGCCSYCGVDVGRDSLNLDHIVPLSLGGEHSRENVTTACRRCNLRKGDYADTEAFRLIVEPLGGDELIIQCQRRTLRIFKRQAQALISMLTPYTQTQTAS